MEPTELKLAEGIFRPETPRTTHVDLLTAYGPFTSNILSKIIVHV